jgi:hypothetical protein
MLVPNLLPKAVAHGPRLLPGLIVRTCGRLVAVKPPLLDPTPTRSPCPSHRLGGSHPGHPRPVAPLSQREGLLALRFLSPALLLPRSVLPEPAQPAHPSLGARVARVAGGVGRELAEPSAVYRVLDTTLIPAIVRVRASRKGLFFCGQATFGRSASKTEWIYGFKVALVVDPEGVVTVFGLAQASSDERPIGEALVASDRHKAYLADKGFTGVQWERRWLEEYGALVAATPYEDSRRAWPKTDRRWASLARQAPDHRGVICQLSRTSSAWSAIGPRPSAVC